MRAMDERWTCRRCYAANDGGDYKCSSCGTPRFVEGTVAVPGEPRRTEPTWQPTPDADATDTHPPSGDQPWQPQQGQPGQSEPPQWQGQPDQPQWQGQPGQPQPWQQPEERRRSPLVTLLSYAWILIPIGFALFYFFGQARRDDSGDIQGPGTLTVYDLRVGDCFNGDMSGSVSDVEARPCSGPHEYEVYGTVTHPDNGGEFPGDDVIGEHADDVCLAEFERFVGVAYEDSALYASWLSPSRESWSNGDRETLCIIHEEDEREVTGSMRGANR